MATTERKRLLALDVMRGVTVSGMILVNNPGSWEHIFAPLRHAEWNGITPTDLVFPFFMYIMGISTAMSLQRYSFKLNARLFVKILKRTVVIFLLGVLLDRVAAFCWGGSAAQGAWLAGAIESAFDTDGIRIAGVLQRLAVCYLFAALMGAMMTRRALLATVVLFLGGYSVLILAYDGLEFADSNIVGIIDRAILGSSHMYHDHAFGTALAFDPEGLLSTIPSIAHTLIGFLTGRMILATPSLNQRMLNLFVVGTIMMIAGFLLSYGMPLNKKIWSPTFVLTTCGMASDLLALLIWIIDVRGKTAWTMPFKVFGINPLFLYVVSGVLAVVLGITVGAVPYQFLSSTIGNQKLASFVYALCFVGINWMLGYPLYRKGIIIKI